MPVKGQKGQQDPATVGVRKKPGPKKGWRDNPDALTKRQRSGLMRRVLLADYRLKGISDPEELAAELGVSKATIYRDFQRLDLWFQERATQDVATLKGIALERIERMIGALWPKAKAGNINAIREIRELLAREARLMGLDAPQNFNVDWRAEARAQGLDPQVLMEGFVQVILAQRGALLDAGYGLGDDPEPPEEETDDVEL